MPVPQRMQDLNTQAASNSPSGSDPIGNSLDDYLRATQAIVRQTNALASASIVSSSTTDIGAADAQSVYITGTASITSLGTSVAGLVRECRFESAATIVASSSIVLPSSSSITTASGDVYTFRSMGSGVWMLVNATRSFGTLPATGGTLTGLLNFNLSGLGNAVNSQTQPLNVFQPSGTGAGANGDQVVLSHFRTAAGAGWADVYWQFQRIVDSSYMGFMRFGGVSGDSGVSFGIGGTIFGRLKNAGGWEFTGDSSVTGSFSCTGAMSSGGAFTAAGNLFANGGTLQAGSSAGTYTQITYLGEVLSNRTYNPASETLALSTSGAFGGGLKMVDGGSKIGLWSNSGALQFGFGTAGLASKASIGTDGVVSAPDFIYTSARALKDEIRVLRHGLDTLKKMLPRQYVKYDNEQFMGNGKPEFGFIHDEVKDAAPEAAGSGVNGYGGVSPMGVLAIVANTVLELDARMAKAGI